MLNQSKVALLSTLSRESPYLATMSLLYVMSKLIGKDFSIIYNHSKVEPQGKPTPQHAPPPPPPPPPRPAISSSRN